MFGMLPSVWLIKGLITTSKSILKLVQTETIIPNILVNLTKNMDIDVNAIVDAWWGRVLDKMD